MKNQNEDEILKDEIDDIKRSLKELGCLNPEDFNFRVQYKLLLWKCPKCKDGFIKCSPKEMNKRIVENTNYCPSCGNHEKEIPTKGIFDIRNNKEPSKKELKLFGVLNPDDYTVYENKNLKAKCSICGDTFTTSFCTLEEQYFKGYKPRCTSCSNKKRKRTKRKYTKERLIELNCVNPDEYEGYYDTRLTFKCQECGKHYKMKIKERLDQVKGGYHTCHACSIKRRANKRRKKKS